MKFEPELGQQAFGGEWEEYEASIASEGLELLSMITSDERHLWPVWRKLIEHGRPSVVFGEQVASPDGRTWLGSVRADLEALGYAVGAADLCAAGVGAPHLRQRLYFVGIDRARFLADAAIDGREQGCLSADARRKHGAGSTDDGRLGKPVSRAVAVPWRDAALIPCADGIHRPVEPGTFPLAHGASARVGRLRAYGNAIVPQVAAEFVGSVMDVLGLAPELNSNTER